MTWRKAGEWIQADGIRVYVEAVEGGDVALRVRATGKVLTFAQPPR